MQATEKQFHIQCVEGDVGRYVLLPGDPARSDRVAKYLDDAKLGEMFYFFELACGVSAYMLGVNPFNQPGVEFYKRNMFQLLGKPGYEA